jgi:hypothetical protein
LTLVNTLDNNEPQQESSWWWPIVIGIGSIAAIGTGYYLWSKKEQKDETPTILIETQDTPQQPLELQQPPIFITPSAVLPILEPNSSILPQNEQRNPQPQIVQVHNHIHAPVVQNLPPPPKIPQVKAATWSTPSIGGLLGFGNTNNDDAK